MAHINDDRTPRGTGLSRRALLVAGAAAAVSPRSASAQRPPPVRRRIHELAADDPIVEALREAVRVLKSRNSGRVSWASIAAIHGTGDRFNRCPHGNWYFLPWHRAYVVMMERIVRQIARMPEFAMPYWDWSRDRSFPSHFAVETVGGRPNPLFERRRARPGQMRIRDAVTGEQVMRRIMRQRDFELFASSRPRRQNDVRPQWINANGVSAQLEANPHNQIHGIVGGPNGLMASPGSAYDPVFWLHHTNVDRIWAMWNRAGNRNTQSPLWLDMTFNQHFLNPDGTALSARVRDLLDPAALGYAYDVREQAPEQPEAAPAVVSLFEALEGLEAGTGGVRVARVENHRSGGVEAPLEIGVRLPEAWQPGAGAGEARPGAPVADPARRATDIMRSLGDEPPAPPPRPQPRPGQAERQVVAIFRDIAAPAADVAAVDIYLKSSRGGLLSPEAHGFVGSFGLFGGPHQDHGHGHGHGQDAGGQPSVLVDLTETLARMTEAGEQPSDELVFQLVAVPITSEHAATPVRPGSVEVAILG